MFCQGLQSGEVKINNNNKLFYDKVSGLCFLVMQIIKTPVTSIGFSPLGCKIFLEPELRTREIFLALLHLIVAIEINARALRCTADGLTAFHFLHVWLKPEGEKVTVGY